jgi:hypothetical protein
MTLRRSLLPLAVMLGLFVLPSLARADFGLIPGTTTFRAVGPDGSPAVQAGSHPYSFTAHFELTNEGTPSRGAVVGLPLGLFGNPTTMPTCSRQEFEGGRAECPTNTQVGVIRGIVEKTGQIAYPVFALAPPPGVVAMFGVGGLGFISLQYATVRNEPGPNGEKTYSLVVSAPNIPLSIIEANETIWGTPSDPSHDAERGEEAISGGPPVSSEVGRVPYLTLPTSCDVEPVGSVAVESILAPGILFGESAPLSDAGGTPTPLIGCEVVPFSPRVTSRPSAASGESSSGLNFELQLPNQGLLSPGGVTETEPEKTEVTLPQGVTINPSAANGIVGCSSSQYAAANGEPGVGCPEASKVGTLAAKTPLLEEAIEGSVYLASPHDNPFNSLLALYIVAKAPVRGVLVKQAGLVQADSTTGQLTTTFDHLPPLPYSSFELNLREGPRAPLITPQACGEYQTTAKLYPFSAPGTATVRTAPFKITSGANGGSCVSGEGQMPAHPTFEAGATSPLAGAYSPFIFRVKRSDGEQRFSSVSATLPTGLLGRIAGVPYCSDAGIATASSRGQEGGGALEQRSPSCSAASQVGTVNVAAGAGSMPYTVQGKVYLAGPYKGAPLSLEIITPAIAGPFDLGSVAVRTALYVNESTAQIRAQSDPLPSILHGIPLDVRTISLNMDKPEFTLNPTNCQAKTVTGSLATLSGGNASLSNPFAVGGCKGLAFKPELKLAFTGQTKRLGNPAIKAVLTQPKGQNANVSGATVILPKGMFIDQAHISNPCTRVQFNSGALPGEGCPAKSILGTAKVWTPLLEAPEEGKVYFRSNGGERELPDLAVALRGQIPLQLLGFIDSVGKKGAEVRRVRSRFLGLPDAPVSRFELKLSGGKKGLLENSKNLCQLSGKAKFQLTGQNGATHDTEPKVQVKCGKGTGGAKKDASKSGGGKKK